MCSIIINKCFPLLHTIYMCMFLDEHITHLTLFMSKINMFVCCYPCSTECFFFLFSYILCAMYANENAQCMQKIFSKGLKFLKF